MNSQLQFSALFDSRQWTSAAELFERSLMQSTRGPQFWIKAAFAAEQANLLDLSGRISKQAATLFPRNIDALNLYPKWLMVNRRWSDAVAAYNTSFGSQFSGSSLPQRILRDKRRAECMTQGIFHYWRSRQPIVSSSKLEQLRKYTPSSRYLFVSGMPRSGTTALGQMLNISSEVCLYVELLPAFQVYEHRSFQGTEFAKKAKNSPHDLNRTNQEKHKSAKFIGDKRPYFFFVQPGTFDMLGKNHVRVLHIIRSIDSTIASYQKRAADPDDHSWPNQQNYMMAIDEINAMNRFIVESADSYSSSQLRYVSYSDVFTKLELAQSLFEFLGVGLSKSELAQLIMFQERSAGVVHKPTITPSEVISYVLTHTDWELLYQAEKLTGCKQRPDWQRDL